MFISKAEKPNPNRSLVPVVGLGNCFNHKLCIKMDVVMLLLLPVCIQDCNWSLQLSITVK